MKLTWDHYRQWLKEDLISEIPSNLLPPGPDTFSTDSRQIAAGDFFIPLVGENFDGHSYIEQAMARGAAGFFFATQKRTFVPSQLRAKGIEVKDPLVAFGQIARGWRSLHKPKQVFALTGSVGKTTTKEILASIANAAGPTLWTKESFNNEIGVPKTLLSLTSVHKYVVLEMGARHPGDIASLCELALPTVAAVLNVGISHLGEFKTREAILNTKTEIFLSSVPDAILVSLRDDQSILARAEATGKKVVTFGKNSGATVKLVEHKYLPTGGMEIIFSIYGDRHSFQIDCAHDAYPINVAGAVAMALAGGISVEVIRDGIKLFKPPPGRFNIFPLKNFKVIDDSYNAGPDSMIAGLATCARMFKQEKKIAVLGDMRELGVESDRAHEHIGSFCAKEFLPDLLITVGKEGEKIAAGATKAGLAKDKILSLADIGAVCRLPEKVFSRREVIYIKGSHALHMEKLVETLKSFS